MPFLFFHYILESVFSSKSGPTNACLVLEYHWTLSEARVTYSQVIICDITQMRTSWWNRWEQILKVAVQVCVIDFKGAQHMSLFGSDSGEMCCLVSWTLKSACEWFSRWYSGADGSVGSSLLWGIAHECRFICLCQNMWIPCVCGEAPCKVNCWCIPPTLTWSIRCVAMIHYNWTSYPYSKESDFLPVFNYK